MKLSFKKRSINYFYYICRYAEVFTTVFDCFLMCNNCNNIIGNKAICSYPILTHSVLTKAEYMGYQIYSQFQGLTTEITANCIFFKDTLWAKQYELHSPHNTEIFMVSGTPALLPVQNACILKMNNFFSYFLIL